MVWSARSCAAGALAAAFVVASPMCAAQADRTGDHTPPSHPWSAPQPDGNRSGLWTLKDSWGRGFHNPLPILDPIGNPLPILDPGRHG